MGGTTRSEFLSDPKTTSAFCDAVVGVLKGKGLSYDLGCSVSDVSDVTASSTIHLLSGVSINYVVSFEVAQSSGAIDSASLNAIAASASQSLISGIESGQFNSQWQSQLLQYGVTDSNLMAATSFSVSSVPEVIIVTDSPTSRPSKSPTIRPTTKPTGKPSFKPTKVPTIHTNSSKKTNNFATTGPGIAIWVFIGLLVVCVTGYLYLKGFRTFPSLSSGPKKAYEPNDPYQDKNDINQLNPMKLDPKSHHDHHQDHHDVTGDDPSDLRRMSILPNDLLSPTQPSHPIAAPLHQISHMPSFLNNVLGTRNQSNYAITTQPNDARIDPEEENESINSRRSDGSNGGTREKRDLSHRIHAANVDSSEDLNAKNANKLTIKPSAHPFNSIVSIIPQDEV